jgi:reprolysin-like metallo-peptidase family M12B
MMKTRIFLILVFLLAGQAFSKIRVGYIVTAAAAQNMSNVYNWVSMSHAFLNQSYANTGFSQPNSNVSAILAYVKVDASYNETGKSYTTMLNDLNGTSDPYFTDVPSDRSMYGVDVVVLVTNNSTLCGQAFAIAAPTSSAYVATYWGCDDGYSYSNIGHEIGHLHGARHAPIQDNSNSTINGNTVTYVHGYCNTMYQFADIMTGNYSSCPSNNTRLNYYSSTSVLILDLYTGGEAVKSDVGRMYQEYFSRLSNAQSIPTGMSGCKDIKAKEFGDVVTTGNIDWYQAVNPCVVNSTGRLALRSPNGTTIKVQNFQAPQGAEMRIVVGGSAPLSKQSSEAQANPPIESRTKPQSSLLSGRMESGMLHVSGRLFEEGKIVSLQVFDLHGKMLYESPLSGSGSGASIPWTLAGNRAVYLRFSTPGSTAMAKPFVALNGASFSME